MRAFLKAQINKTDRNDARGIAQMMRAGLYRPVQKSDSNANSLAILSTHSHGKNRQGGPATAAILGRGEGRGTAACAGRGEGRGTASARELYATLSSQQCSLPCQ